MRLSDSLTRKRTAEHSTRVQASYEGLVNQYGMPLSRIKQSRKCTQHRSLDNMIGLRERVVQRLEQSKIKSKNFKAIKSSLVWIKSAIKSSILDRIVIKSNPWSNPICLLRIDHAAQIALICGWKIQTKGFYYLVSHLDQFYLITGCNFHFVSHMDSSSL